MPRRDIDYSKTIIYKIVCNDLNITYTYVGSTTDLTKRKNQHKTDCNNPNGAGHNYKLYTTIRENGGWSNWSVVLVENYPCDSGTEARKRERYFYELYNADLNVIRPFTSDVERVEQHKERGKQYHINNIEKIKKNYVDNAEKIKEQRREHYAINSISINDKLKEKHNCECGGKYTTRDKSTHYKTNKHQNFIETNATI